MMLSPGPVPLYIQLKDIIKSKIDSSELNGNERLPSESEIGAEYNVSRATVRQALLELELEGFIYRVRGKGTFVTDKEGLKQLSSKGTIENLIAAAQGSRLRFLEIRQVTPPARIGDILGLEKDQTAQRIEAVRSSRNGPYGYSLLYLPQTWADMISWDEYAEDMEFLLFVEDRTRNRIYRATQIVSVGLADTTMAKHLSMSPKDPVLVIEREYFIRDGSALFVSVTYNRPDRFQYKVDLTRA